MVITSQLWPVQSFSQALALVDRLSEFLENLVTEVENVGEEVSTLLDGVVVGLTRVSKKVKAVRLL